MMPQIYKEIDAAVSAGETIDKIANELIQKGYPQSLVLEAVDAYMLANGRMQIHTSFNAWLSVYRRKALPAIIVLVGISVVSSSVLLLQPWPTKILVDSVFGNITAPGPLAPFTHQPALILITSLMTIGIFLLSMFFGTIKDYVTLRLSFWLNRGIKEESLRHILHLPLYHPQRLPKGDYLYRQNSLTDSLSELVLGTTASIIQSIIMIAGILVIMFLFNPLLTFISIILVPFLFLLTKLFGPILGKISRQLTIVNSDTSATVAESIDNSETIQAFNLHEKQITKTNNLWLQWYGLSRRALLWGRGYRFVNGFLIILGTSMVMYFGGTAALNQEMTLGQLLIFMTYMGFLLGPVENIAILIAERNQKKVDVGRVYDVLTDHEGVETLRQERSFSFNRGEIEFQNVSYTYRNLLVLNRINLHIKQGQKIGIIGPSGGGKSSLLKLLPLFLEPTTGRILVDGTDIQSVSLSQLRQRIVWISQAPQLFNESVLENLLDGDIQREIQEAEVNDALQAADVTEFISRLPNGLQSTVGEGGNMLSGGQKQRLAIARGLIKKASIVCMDEPTAALDSKSEKNIRDSIAKLIDGKTVLMVTHRKALLSLMDKIYVMDNGQLHNVEEYGGLEKYLRKISDTEDSGENHRNDILRLQAQLTSARLEAEKQQLLEELQATNDELSLRTERADDGTIYINH